MHRNIQVCRIEPTNAHVMYMYLYIVHKHAHMCTRLPAPQKYVETKLTANSLCKIPATTQTLRMCCKHVGFRETSNAALTLYMKCNPERLHTMGKY